MLNRDRTIGWAGDGTDGKRSRPGTRARRIIGQHIQRDGCRRTDSLVDGIGIVYRHRAHDASRFEHFDHRGHTGQFRAAFSQNRRGCSLEREQSFTDAKQPILDYHRDDPSRQVRGSFQASSQNLYSWPGTFKSLRLIENDVMHEIALSTPELGPENDNYRTNTATMRKYFEI
ncbi:MAG: hypothetical protein JWP89_6817 [Schlesneria sp.]|nr:hypothetical protein [Schlesneria sp.]